MVLHALQRIQGWNRAFAGFVVLAIPVALFHYASGRVGNGLMATGAILLGLTLVILEARQRAAPAAEAPAEVVLGPDDYWWPDAADHLDDDAWLDRITDEPLPAPFQAVMDELQRVARD